MAHEEAEDLRSTTRVVGGQVKEGVNPGMIELMGDLLEGSEDSVNVLRDSVNVLRDSVTHRVNTNVVAMDDVDADWDFLRWMEQSFPPPSVIYTPYSPMSGGVFDMRPVVGTVDDKGTLFDFLNMNDNEPCDISAPITSASDLNVATLFDDDLDSFVDLNSYLFPDGLINEATDVSDDKAVTITPTPTGCTTSDHGYINTPPPVDDAVTGGQGRAADGAEVEGGQDCISVSDHKFSILDAALCGLVSPDTVNSDEYEVESLMAVGTVEEVADVGTVLSLVEKAEGSVDKRHYRQRRDKNNAASKNSRETRKRKFEVMDEEGDQLEEDNERLREKIVVLEKAVSEMKAELIKVVTAGVKVKK